MEAARVASLRGHTVALWEKSSRLGGNLVPASVPDFKKDVKHLIAYLSTQIGKLGVTVELGKEATVELVKKANPEALIIATGATPIVPKIPGIGKPSVMTAIDLFLGNKEAGETIVIAGGGVIGCEIGFYLAQKAKKVTIVEMLEALASDMFEDNRKNLLQILTECGVTLLVETSLEEIIDGGAIVKNKMGRTKLKADSVVLALGLKSEGDLLNAPELKGLSPISIGDCVKPGKIIDAVWQGFRVGRLI